MSKFRLSDRPVSSVKPDPALPPIGRDLLFENNVVGHVTQPPGETLVEDAIFVDDFPKLCTRTEAINSDQQVRIQRALGSLLASMKDVVKAGEEVDRLKKFIFYGKETTVVPGDEPKDVGIRAIRNLRLLHGVMGAVTEPAEMLDQVYKHIFEGEDLDVINIFEEMGDTHWYFGLICDVLGYDMMKVLRMVIKKLMTRYPDKFTEVQALVRDLESERKSLES